MIPRTIHFIWAGGATGMPAGGLANVAAWARANPGFAIRLWVDERTDPAVRARYAGLPAEIVDIGAAGLASPEVRYELDGNWPNYGATSDLLRYAVLHAQGGVYVDCLDVFPGVPLAGLPVLASDAPTLLLHVTPHAVGGDREGPGTEAMVCSPAHPVVADLLVEARAAFDGPRWGYKRLRWACDRFEAAPRSAPGARPRRADGPLDVWGRPPITDLRAVVRRRAVDTLDLTGPGMVLRRLGGAVPVMARRDWVTLPAEHALSWAPMRIVARPYPQALDAALASLRFEVDRMGLFNYHAHIEQIACAAAGAAPEPATDATRARIHADLFERLRGDGARFRLDPRYAVTGEPLRQLLMTGTSGRSRC
jgi:hypothetical protein